MMGSLVPKGHRACTGVRNATPAKSAAALSRVSDFCAGGGISRRRLRPSSSSRSSSPLTLTRAATDPPPAVNKATYSAPTDAPPNPSDDEDLLQYPDRARWVSRESFFCFRFSSLVLGRRPTLEKHGKKLPPCSLATTPPVASKLKKNPKQYVAKFAAADQPDWNAARLVAVDELLPGAVRLVTLEAEVSRERVPLRNAYLSPGQHARVRVLGGGECAVPVASPPPRPALNHAALVAARGDIRANETKAAREPESALARVQLWVTESDAPDLWAARPGETLLELGPFKGTGVELKEIAGAFAFPTLVLFVSGEGVAPARALLGAAPGAGGLVLNLRRDVVVYYKAPNARSLAFADELESKWAQRAAEAGGFDGNSQTAPKIHVVTATRGESFAEMFDDDDELEYDPAQTAAIIFTGNRQEEGEDGLGAGAGAGGKKSERQEQAEADEKDALEAAAAAEIAVVVRGDLDAEPVKHTETAKV